MERTPVLVVGAGLAGLSTATFLGLHGVASLAVERHPGTSTQPKARGQTPQTMEALRIAGVAERVRDAGFDMNTQMEIVIAESVTGRVLHQVAENIAMDLTHLSPAGMAMAGQERTEAILADRVRELGAQVRFSTELTSFTQDADGVTATLQTEAGEQTVRADYLVAADGWRAGIRSELGDGAHGRGRHGGMVSVVFDADLGDLFAGRDFVLYYLQNPGLRHGTGGFGVTDTPGRYVVLFGYDPETDEPVDEIGEDVLVDQVRTAMGMPDLTVRIVDRAQFEMASRVADRFSAGRVFLVGDAAHVMAPTGGQGGNTAVMDGFYLGWKLAYVIRGLAGPGLLDSHDAERRPFGDLVTEQQYANYVARMAPQLRDGSEAELLPFESMLGYRHLGGAVITDPGDDEALVEDATHPTGRPGSHAPHVWLDRDGARLSTVDLFGGGFVLLTASPSWTTVASAVSDRLGVPIETHVLDAGEWLQAYGIGAEGASLVRPDRFVAWRSRSAGSAADLEKALRVVLSR